MFVEIAGTVRKLLCESTTASEAQTANLRNARTLIRVKLRTGISQKPTSGPKHGRAGSAVERPFGLTVGLPGDAGGQRAVLWATPAGAGGGMCLCGEGCVEIEWKH